MHDSIHPPVGFKYIYTMEKIKLNVFHYILIERNIYSEMLQPPKNRILYSTYFMYNFNN